MKNHIAISFLCIYLAAGLLPQLSFIDYFINQDYIAKVLCINKEKPKMNCDGQCYLAKKLKAAEENNQDKPFSPPSTEFNISFFIHKVEPILIKPISTLIVFLKPVPENLISQQHFKTPTPPPKFFPG